MNRRRIAAMFFSAGIINTYLSQLLDQFTTTEAAPLTSPRTCEPGPGTLTITDTGNKLSVASGQMVKTGGTFLIRSTGTYTRANGLSFYLRMKNTTASGSGNFGASENGTTVTDGFYPTAGTLLARTDGTNGPDQVGVFQQLIDAMHDAVIIHRSAGSFVFIRGGRFGKWHLLFPIGTSDGANVYWLYKNNAATDTGVLDNAIVATVGGAFATDYGFATHHSASPSSPIATVTTSRDAFVEFTWTPASDETLEIYARQVDTNNRLILRCSQAGSTIKLIRVTSGTETEMQSAAQTWTASTPYKITFWMHMANVRAAVDVTIKLSQTTVVNEFGTGYGASGFTTGANFAVYKMGITDLPAPFDFSGFRWFLMYGDSKTLGGDAAAYLADKLEVSTGSRWCHNLIGRAGYTLALMVALITSDLAIQDETPEYILVNLGANDVVSLPAEATWKANLRTLLDAFHAKWASAKVYIMRVWRRGEATDCDTLATWINDVVGEAAYSGFCYNGPDERVFLENGDDGVTYTTDGVHPTTAGYVLTAAQWQTSIGL